MVEQDTVSHIDELLSRFPSVRHHFLLNSGNFRKVEAVNVGALMTDRRYVCIYDADVLVSPKAIDIAVHAMENSGWKIVLPYNRVCLDVRGPLRERLGRAGVVTGYDRLRALSAANHIPDASARFVNGGIVMVHREVFLAEGGLNRKMISYGWEDTELVKRLSSLGYPFLSVAGYNLIHLDHDRGVDSRPNDYYDVNMQEFRRIAAMSRAELIRYVESDLSLTCRGDTSSLARIRATAQSERPVYWMRLKAGFNLLRIHTQALGLVNFFAAGVVRAFRRPRN